jgi:hypothetical protein
VNDRSAIAIIDESGSPSVSKIPFCAEDHDEWLLDEALAETFPASDPISPAGQMPCGRLTYPEAT